MTAADLDTRASSTAASSVARIELRGLRERNLRSIDLDVPLRQLSIVCGPTGAGRHSLVFATLHAEGQRRYVESFSLSQQRWLDQIERPDADRLSGIPPAIALRDVDLTGTGTLAELAGLAAPLCAAWAEFGTFHCPTCQQALPRWTTSRVLQAASALPEGARWIVAAPQPPTNRATPQQFCRQARERGFARAIVGRAIVSLADLDRLDLAEDAQDVAIVIDRLVVGRSEPARVREAIELAQREGHGLCRLYVPREALTVSEWSSARTVRLNDDDWALQTAGETPYCDQCQMAWPALQPSDFERLLRQPASSFVPSSPASSHLPAAAPAIVRREGVLALPPEAIGATTLAGQTFPAMIDLPVAAALRFWPDPTADTTAPLAPQLREVRQRLAGLNQLGLGSLTLRHPAAELSRSAVRRTQLASALVERMTGTLILADEPCSGVPSEEWPLVHTALLGLVHAGNTVVVVDDPAAYQSLNVDPRPAQVIELGPGSGSAGGQVVWQGALPEWLSSPDAGDRTFSSLAALSAAATPAAVHQLPSGWQQEQRDDDLAHLLKPAQLTLVRGATGVGKSLLLRRLVAATTTGQIDVADWPTQAQLLTPATHRGQARGLLVQWLEVWTEIREMFAQTLLARQRGWTATMFSFHSAQGGRCRRCRGRGELRAASEWLPETRTVCPDCRGTRFRAEVLEVRSRGKSIAEVLNLPVGEAADFFRALAKVQGALSWLKRCGLAHLRLGEPLAQIPPGAWQRLQVVRLGASPLAAPTLLACDEPLAGLGADDVALVVGNLRELVAIGHTVLLADEHPAAPACVDRILELAPAATHNEGNRSAGEPP